MPNYTEHYNLIKPGQDENYNVGVANTNNGIIDQQLFNKVNKENGKGLSSNDFTNEYKAMCDNLKTTISNIETAESTRVAAENTRVSNESTRVSNEESRVSAETARANAETSRATSFNTKMGQFDEAIEEFGNTIAAVQFVSFKVDDNGELFMHRTTDMENLRFRLNEETGELEVNINGG